MYYFIYYRVFHFFQKTFSLLFVYTLFLSKWNILLLLFTSLPVILIIPFQTTETIYLFIYFHIVIFFVFAL